MRRTARSESCSASGHAQRRRIERVPHDDGGWRAIVRRWIVITAIATVLLAGGALATVYGPAIERFYLTRQWDRYMPDYEMRDKAAAVPDASVQEILLYGEDFGRNGDDDAIRVTDRRFIGELMAGLRNASCDRQLVMNWGANIVVRTRAASGGADREPIRAEFSSHSPGQGFGPQFADALRGVGGWQAWAFSRRIAPRVRDAVSARIGWERYATVRGAAARAVLRSLLAAGRGAFAYADFGWPTELDVRFRSGQTEHTIVQPDEQTRARLVSIVGDVWKSPTAPPAPPSASARSTQLLLRSAARAKVLSEGRRRSRFWPW